MRLFRAAIAFSVLLLAGCASERALYDTALDRSAVFQEANVRPLKPLAYPVTALTLTNDASWAVGQEGKTIPLNNGYGTWITVEPEVKEICKTYPRADIIGKLHYLLGLKPAVEADKSAKFVRFTVAKQDNGPTGAGIFRPCADPDPSKQSCGNRIAGSADFVAWFANQQVFSYRKGPEISQTGYPWTRLGYTYNWDPAATDIRGAQEYIVPDKTLVTVTEIVPAEEYCGRP